MQVFLAESEPSLARMNALHHVLHTQAVPLTLLDQVVKQLRIERNEAVQSFVYTTLVAFTTTKNPCEKK